MAGSCFYVSTGLVVVSNQIMVFAEIDFVCVCVWARRACIQHHSPHIIVTSSLFVL